MEEKENVLVSTRWAYRVLYITFIVAPITAGLDKFLHLLTDWNMYLSPAVSRIIPIDSTIFMRAVGVVEICAGIIVAIKPRIGSLIVSLWLLGITVNFLTSPAGFYDVALRDLGLALAALALFFLSPQFCRCSCSKDNV